MIEDKRGLVWLGRKHHGPFKDLEKRAFESWTYYSK